MTTLTYEQCVALLANIAAYHRQIQYFGHGELWEINGTPKRLPTYPVLWAVPTSTTVNENTVNHGFRLLVFDLVETGEGNEHHVLSDCQQILIDVIKVLRYSEQHFELVGDPVLEPFTERFADQVTGWSAVVEIEVSLMNTDCDVPIDEFITPAVVQGGIVLPSQGFSGYSGYSGFSGFSGTNGISGYSGSSGFSGFNGEAGASGFSGFSGTSGFSGVSGFSGTSGFSGASVTGASGTSGFSGRSGFSGFSGASSSRVVLTSNVANNNAVANTMADITGLTFTIPNSGDVYWFRMFVTYISAGAGNGSRWSVSANKSVNYHYQSEYSLTSTSKTFNTGLQAADLPAASNPGSASTGSNIAIVEGTITANAPTVTVVGRFASEGAGLAIIALANVSFIEYKQIA